jgi:hypothetical protein
VIERLHVRDEGSVFHSDSEKNFAGRYYLLRNRPPVPAGVWIVNKMAGSL